VTNVTDTTISLVWQSPQPANGIVQQYRVIYWETDMNTSVVQLTMSASLHVYNITSLNPATGYSLQVYCTAWGPTFEKS